MSVNTKNVEAVLTANGIKPAKRISRPFPAGRPTEPNTIYVCRSFEVQVYNDMEQAIFVVAKGNRTAFLHKVSEIATLEGLVEALAPVETALMEQARASALSKPVKPVRRRQWQNWGASSAKSVPAATAPTPAATAPSKPVDIEATIQEQFNKLSEAIERGDV